MTVPLPAVLHVSAADVLGGAERIARQLHESVLARGGASWLAVGQVHDHVAATLQIPNDVHRSAWTRAWERAADAWEAQRGPRALAVRVARGPLANPSRWLAWQRGHEDFDFPGTRALLDLPPQRPDVLHLHNLHPQYFDLRALPALSRRVPTLMTLHDQWLTTGHCSYSLDCERWVSGCGPCPYLSAYPALHHDGTRFNWTRKNQLVAASRLHVAVPSEWLRGLVERSRLAPSLQSLRLMRQGVDLDVFSDGDQQAARRRVGLPDSPDGPVVLLQAASLRDYTWKGGIWVREAVARFAASALGRRATIVAVGDATALEALPALPIRFAGVVSAPTQMADYYRASDLFVHPSRTDNYPNAIMESMACGTPVVGTTVGGIPEQIRPDDASTGALVPPEDPAALAGAMSALLDAAPEARRARRAATRADAMRRFDARDMVNAYLAWYTELAATAAEAS